MPTGFDTGKFCAHHIDFAREIEHSKAELSQLQRDKEALTRRVDELSDMTGKLQGFYDGSIPELQKSVDKLFDLMEARDETADVYYGNMRAMVGTVESHTKELRDKAEKSLVADLKESAASKESVKNCYMWVRIGFVTLAGSFLLWIVSIIANKLGAPLL